MKIKIFNEQGDTGRKVFFWCPGCNELHNFIIERTERPCWSFDGNMENPTLNPSLLYPDKKPRCHLFLHNGKLAFCSDSEHSLANSTVDLPDLPEWFVQLKN